MTDQRFVFIGGTGRSGTTLMHKMLCMHPKLIGGPEFDHLRPIMELRRHMMDPSKLERQAAFYDRRRLDRVFAQFVKSLLQGIGTEGRGSEIIVEKTPSNVEVIPDLLELLPNSKFIAMIRDGRDVTASHLVVLERMLAQNPELESRWQDEFKVRHVSRIWRANLSSI